MDPKDPKKNDITFKRNTIGADDPEKPETFPARETYEKYEGQTGDK